MIIMNKRTLLLNQCWTWDAQRENLIPITEESIDTLEITDIFSRAQIISSQGNMYLGYIHEGLWNFGLFHKNEEFSFNISCPEYFLKEIQNILCNKDATLEDFFPIKYIIEQNNFLDDDFPLSGLLDYR